MNELAIKTHDIDWLKIIDLAFKKKDWGKTYVLFQYRKVTITCKMTSFDFEDNKALFRINYNFVEEDFDDSWDNYTSVTCWMNNFTIKEFKRVVLRTIVRTLNELFKSRTRTKAERMYEELKYSSYDVDEENIGQQGLLEDYDAILSIENEDVKRHAIMSLKDQVVDILNKEYDEKVNNFCKDKLQVVEELDHIKKAIEEALEKEL